MPDEPMTLARLDELDRLHEAATPEPWDVDWSTTAGLPYDYTINDHQESDEEAEANAFFIAALRNAYPELVSLARRALEMDQPKCTCECGCDTFAGNMTPELCDRCWLHTQPPEIREQFERAEDDIRHGRLINHEDVKKELL